MSDSAVERGHIAVELPPLDPRMRVETRRQLRRRCAGVSHFQRPRHHNHCGIAVEEVFEAFPYRGYHSSRLKNWRGDNKAVAAATRRE